MTCVYELEIHRDEECEGRTVHERVSLERLDDAWNAGSSTKDVSK